MTQNDTQMHHIHITAMHVNLIRAGGYLDFGQPITEQDWDNWQYVARNSRKEHDRQCRPRLAELRVASGGVKRRRRHSTPPRAGEDDAPENMDEEGYQCRLDILDSSDPGEWPGEFAAGKRRR